MEPKCLTEPVHLPERSDEKLEGYSTEMDSDPPKDVSPG